jgi:hypothetical protein
MFLLLNAISMVRDIRSQGLAIGLWGGVDREGIMDDDWAEPKRFFSMRSDAHLKEMLERQVKIEAFETVMHQDDPNDHYQWCVVRAP